jgi:hypothetical protein
MTRTYEHNDAEAKAFARKWQIAVAVLVAVGSLVTAGYAWVETFWG